MAKDSETLENWLWTARYDAMEQQNLKLQEEMDVLVRQIINIKSQQMLWSIYLYRWS